MTLVRLSSTPTIEQIEHAYRTFLRKTWLGVPALIELCIGIIAKTRVFANPDGTPSQRNYLFDGVVAFYIVLFPLIVLALAFKRGCNELRTIAFGRLVWWQILLYGVVLGAIGQFSGRVIFPLFGGAIVSANNDPNLVGAILNSILIVILTPITEEAIFRVVLQTYLQRYGTAIAVVGTVVAFIFFHLTFFDRFPTHDDLLKTFVLIPIPALILSVARRYSGSLLLTLLIHSADNALGFLGPQDVQHPGCC